MKVSLSSVQMSPGLLSPPVTCQIATCDLTIVKLRHLIMTDLCVRQHLSGCYRRMQRRPINL